MAIENGTNSYMPPRVLSIFENELSPLMAFLGNEDDYVLYNNPKPNYFIDFWKKLNIELPQLVNSDQIDTNHISNIVPWGWSQLIDKKQQYLSTNKNNYAHFKTHEENKHFFSRLTSVKLINELSKMTLPDIVNIPTLPRIVNTLEEIDQLLKRQPNGLVIKNLWSSSGRGLLFIKDEKTYAQNRNWIVAQLKKQKKLIIEPIYNKVQDASLQFTINKDQNYVFLGINYFDSDEEGHFEKEYLHTPEKIQNKLPKDNQWIQQVAKNIILSMQKQNIHQHYKGAIGVDVMFILDKNKQLKLYPIVEANLRCNMGLINLHIKKLLDDNSIGHWQIDTFKEGEAMAFYQQQIEEHPILLKSNKIKQGFIPLTPVDQNTRFAAWGLIESDSKKTQ